ncbi:MAG: asparagine synthase-related protein [Clostridiales bacterium]|nr:asparagine synthase C-terminal domain-containing protein [Eubacteriales bacterium]MDH7566584.1 asparagine synthase-related protein [Clostridiales bacterium]
MILSSIFTRHSTVCQCTSIYFFGILPFLSVFIYIPFHPCCFRRAAFSGECADEVFGGYPWFHREDLTDTGTFPMGRVPISLSLGSSVPILKIQKHID